MHGSGTSRAQSQRRRGVSKPERPLDITYVYVSASLVFFLCIFHAWARRWLISGAPLLTLLLLIGSAHSTRVLPFISLWTLIATLNVFYALAATSWLLHGFFTASCYPAIGLTCLFQFQAVADVVRRRLRIALGRLHFVNDTVAFFDIPALEIDTEVAGLLVVRGIEVSLSTLTVVAHGIEVGIRLTPDVEMAIQTERVTVSLLRHIEVSDTMVNIKGGEYEMTFGKLEDDTEEAGGDSIMVEGTALLKMAAGVPSAPPPKVEPTASRLTDGQAPHPTTPQGCLDSLRKISPDNIQARRVYESTIQWISQTSSIHDCRQKVYDYESRVQAAGGASTEYTKTPQLRAAICSQMHRRPSVPHPPRRSIKVSTLKSLMDPRLKSLLHRMPLLLRLLLNPLSYFHPVSITSITAAASGKWLSSLLSSRLFQDYAAENMELRHLQRKIFSWLGDANFCLELAGIEGVARVPLLSGFDIFTSLTINDVLAFRTLPLKTALTQVVRLGGADARFTIPLFLLPHHEHLLPPLPGPEEKAHLMEKVKRADGLPKREQKRREATQAMGDRASVHMAAHARLPAVLEKDLLDFLVALIKTLKVVELEKEPSAMSHEVKGLRDFGRCLKSAVKENAKKAAVDGVLDERLVSKLVGKVTRKLESAQGEVGWAGELEVELGGYRLPVGHVENHKILA